MNKCWIALLLMLPTLLGAGFGQEVREEALEATEERGGGGGFCAHTSRCEDDDLEYTRS